MKRFAMLMCVAVLSACAADTGDDEEDDSVAETEAEALTTFSPAQKHNLHVINQYRAKKNLVPLRLSPRLSQFAHAGSVELSNDHIPHKHFIDAGQSLFQKGFKASAGENQGDPHGWPKLSADPAANKTEQIDQIQKAMFDEGPGPGEKHGHYRNMMNPKFRRVGIGLLEVNGKLYLTNDFSE